MIDLLARVRIIPVLTIRRRANIALSAPAGEMVKTLSPGVNSARWSAA